MRISQRFQELSVTHPLSMNRKIDQYLSERLPDLMAEYDIADRSDISKLGGRFDRLESRMDDLEEWRKKFEERLSSDRNRMERLKIKFGVK
jgi:polyhydroxyalkanoate synthesis regulator phasin